MTFNHFCHSLFVYVLLEGGDDELLLSFLVCEEAKDETKVQPLIESLEIGIT